MGGKEILWLTFCKWYSCVLWVRGATLTLTACIRLIFQGQLKQSTETQGGSHNAARAWCKRRNLKIYTGKSKIMPFERREEIPCTNTVHSMVRN